jgi:hypothetical protein
MTASCLLSAGQQEPRFTVLVPIYAGISAGKPEAKEKHSMRKEELIYA